MSRRIAFRAILLAATVCLILSSVLSVQRPGVSVTTKSGRGSARGRMSNARNTRTNTTRQEFNSPKLAQQIADRIARKQSRTPLERKIDPQLLDVASAITNKVAAKTPTIDAVNLRHYSRKTLRVNDSGEIEVYAAIGDYTDQKVRQLENAGMKVSRTYTDQNVVVGWVPYQSLTNVAQLGFVSRVSRPSYAITRVGRVTNEGDSVHRFDLVRSLFFTPSSNAGSGIRVGVMSDSTDHLSLVQATLDAPTGNQIHVIQSPGDPNPNPPIPPNTGDEGTALIELIHDVAPGSPISFYGPVDSFDFLQGLTQLQNDQSKIIIDDLAFFDEPKFEDGPLAIAVRNFVNGGGVYVTSAGNDAQNHYIGNFVPVDPPQSIRDVVGANNVVKVHNFASSGTDIGDSLVVPGDSDKNSDDPTNVPQGGDIVVALQWNNPFGSSADDFDLYLIDDVTGNIVAESFNFQDGNPADDGANPNEVLEYVNDSGLPQSLSCIIVQATALVTSPPTKIRFNLLFAPINFSDSNHQYNVATDSIAGHSAVEEAIVVGAADELTPNVPESFTSQGPASILIANHAVLANPLSRNVPTVVGVDGISNRVGQLADPNTGIPFFISPFFGTSASASEVAGLAALVWSARPQLTGAQVKNAIKDNAIDMTGAAPLAVGFDFQTGFGRADGVSAFATLSGLTANKPKIGFVEVSDLQAPAINFGTVNVLTPLDKPLTLINYGNTPLTVSSIGDPAGSSAFTIPNKPAGGFTIAPGKTSAPFMVRFTPTSGGQVSATITVTTDVAGTNQVSLSGTGRANDANDNCANATVINSQAFGIIQDTALATNEVGDPNSTCSANQPGSHTVWFKYRASTTGPTTINTFGSSYDTVLSVLTGSCSAFTPVTCNNDSPTAGKPPQSEVTFSAVTGTTYFIEVSSPTGGQGGTLMLNGFLTITPPTDVELKVDDGSFDHNQSVGLTNPPATMYVVNRLTPGTYPATLDQIKLQFLSQGPDATQTSPAGIPVKVGDKIKLIYAANPPGSGPSDPQRLGISSGQTFQTMDVTIPVLDQFFVIDVPDLTITSGDFLVGYETLQLPNMFPAIQDTDNSQRRSYISSDGINFDLADTDGVPGNWAIRALVKQGSATLTAPSSINFGSILVNNVSDQTATLSNNSNNDLIIDSISDPPAPYSAIGKPAAGTVLHPGDSVSFTVRFAPTTAGSPPGSIVIATKDPINQNPSTTITLTGTGIQTTISVDPPPFGNVTTGKTAQKTITVSNTGTTPLTISIISSLAPTSPGGAGTFALSGLPNLPATVGVGSNITFTASLTPNVRGAMSTSFTITSDGSASPVTVNLTGTGVSPTFTVTPPSAAFGTVLQNSAPNPITLTLANNSQDTLVITSISNPASPFGLTGLPATFPVTVNAGSLLSFNVTMNTSSGGNFSSSITVTSNTATSPATINVTGSVGTPQLSVATTLDFGPFKVGRISSKILTVSNTGNGTLNVTFGPTSDPQHFTYTGLTANQSASIPPFASIPVTVNFAPDATIPFSATINVTSNSNTNPSPTITLTGSGSNVNHAPSGTALSFSATVNLASTQLLRGTDSDNDPLTFSVVSQPTLGTITAFDAATGIFTYKATSAGSDSFTFKVNDGVVDSATQTVTITNVTFKFGDMNLDGTVNVGDLVFMANFLAGNNTLTPTQRQAGDVFQTGGTINVQDLLTLANFLAGNIHQLPVVPGAANMPADNLPFLNMMPSSHIAQAGTFDYDEHWLDRPKWLREPGYLQGYFGLF